MVTSQASEIRQRVETAKERRKRINDDMIMHTNGSCIVSKRSVEKVYHGEDHGFLRHFVQKFQRRSPLINRGYWLRMRAVEHAVRTFLSNHPHENTCIVNLGCGYDTLPFKFLAKEPQLCEHSKFIDVDYRKLLEKKCEVIGAKDCFRGLCGQVESDVQTQNVLFDSNQYAAIAADLQSESDLQQLKQILNAQDGRLLFIAEVSMTYMAPTDANNVIKWASSFPKATFSLLEQYLPLGESHRFAETMLQHFSKLQSPIRCALTSPSLEDQKQRFTANGWTEVSASSLWSFWTDDNSISAEERSLLDEVEPFDEWEEFILYARHYFLLTAQGPLQEFGEANSELSGPKPRQHSTNTQDNSLFCKVQQPSRGHSPRRLFAGSLATAERIVCNGGYGPQGRLQSSDAITKAIAQDSSMAMVADAGHALEHETACHTITRLKSGSHLLVGGRLSPAKARSECLVTTGDSWRHVENLPTGRYRHSTVVWGEGVLVIGGKLDSGRLAEDWLFWEAERGWSKVTIIGDMPPLRYGACASELSMDFTQTSSAQCSAILLGGMSWDGRILEDVWQIDLLSQVPSAGPMVRCWQPTMRFSGPSVDVFRFGAVLTPQRDELFMTGGVGNGQDDSHESELLRLNNHFEVIAHRILPCRNDPAPRSTFIGHQVSSVGPNTLVIYGGGANCFSFGSFWNEDIITLDTRPGVKPITPWVPVQANELDPSKTNSGRPDPRNARRNFNVTNTPSEYPLPIKRDHVGTAADFQSIIAQRNPAIIEQLDIGECCNKWTSQYLIDSIGRETAVTVHCAEEDNMSFLDKNFSYVKKPFGSFMDSIEQGGREYMRSISSSKPSEKATNLEHDFPAIATDFQLPSELAFVMANVLCQIRGTKRLLLYAPREVSNLQFPPGSSSSKLIPWTEDHGLSPSLRDVPALEANLEPGDVLFIPPLWAHTASPMGGMSVAVNVFFKDMDTGYAVGRDVYGNRDLQAYENGRKDVDRIVRSFKRLPAPCSRFYLQRLADELSEAAEKR
ncbi:MAG: hypothetical protein Q9162_000234 [Coniocarpon cinnabarinum]